MSKPVVPGIEVPLLTFTCTRDTGGRQKYMQTKYSYTKINLKKKKNLTSTPGKIIIFSFHIFIVTQKTEITTFKVGIKQKNQTSFGIPKSQSSNPKAFI